MRTRGVAMLVSLFITTAIEVSGQSLEVDTATKVSFGGFVDTYYAFDFNRPRSIDRAFTTQAARHNEFNVNLAFVDATLAADRLRGRVALQAGTSVQANYAPEPDIGTVSGPELSRFVQEAVVGYRVTQRIWLDAGIFMSSFGSENWTSRDNWTYTRSLIAENSPYYESGIKATWRASPSLTAQVHLINGWQNISESNYDKAVGFRLDYSASPKVNLSYDAFVGNEAADSLETATRIWQEGIVTLIPGSRFQVRGTVDYGVQDVARAGTDSWWGYSLIGRYAATQKLHVALRTESYEDPDQIIVVTGLPYGFRASGWSLNADFEPTSRLVWRVEWRELSSRKPLFPNRTNALVRRDKLLVASAALTF